MPASINSWALRGLERRNGSVPLSPRTIRPASALNLVIWSRA
jgi:hypothetical protein